MGLTAQAQNLLNQVYALFGRENVTVTSTSRSAGANASIRGASSTSQHLTGNAFDFVVKGMDPLDVQRVIAGSPLSFGQSIAEYGAGMGPRNHLGVGAKGQLLTGQDGRYTTTGYKSNYAAAVGAPTFANSDGAGSGRDYLKSVLGDSWGNYLSDGMVGLGGALAAPGEKLFGGLGLSDWFTRITFGLFALLLIAVALYMLSGNTVKDIAGKMPPIVPV